MAEHEKVSSVAKIVIYNKFINWKSFNFFRDSIKTRFHSYAYIKHV